MADEPISSNGKSGIRMVRGKNTGTSQSGAAKLEQFTGTVSETPIKKNRFEFIGNRFMLIPEDNSSVRIPFNMVIGEYLIEKNLIGKRELTSQTYEFPFLGEKIPVPSMFRKNKYENALLAKLYVDSEKPTSTKIRVYGRKNLQPMEKISKELQAMLKDEYDFDLVIPIILESTEGKQTDRWVSYGDF